MDRSDSDMNANFLFDIDAYSKRPRRCRVRPNRLSRHPEIERALEQLKQTIDEARRERAAKPRTYF